MWFGISFAISKSAVGLDVLYDCESGGPGFAIDKLTDDGAQNGRFVNNVATTTFNAPFGMRAAVFDEPDDQEDLPPFSTLEILGTLFDPNFSLTVAMHIDNKETELDFTRLFSTFQGTGALVPERSIC